MAKYKGIRSELPNGTHMLKITCNGSTIICYHGSPLYIDDKASIWLIN